MLHCTPPLSSPTPQDTDNCTEPTGDDDHAPSTAEIAGAAAGITVGVALTAVLIGFLVLRHRRTQSEPKPNKFYPADEDQPPLRERYRNRTIRGLGASVRSTQKILSMYSLDNAHDGDEGLEMIDEGPDLGADLSGYLASMPNDQKMLMERMRVRQLRYCFVVFGPPRTCFSALYHPSRAV